MAELTADTVGGRLEEVRRRIVAAGGSVEGVRIVAVTKGFGTDAVAAAIQAGCTDIGENYAQELVAKAPAAAESGARFHFLGGIQRNKIGRIASLVDLWQSVDRLEIGEAIARKAPGAKVLVQVDLLDGTRPGRAGVAVAEVGRLVEQIQGLALRVQGLMAVGPPPPADPEPGFRAVVALARELVLPEVSIGMSGDLEPAVRAGTTMVRVGTALFGARPATTRT